MTVTPTSMHRGLAEFIEAQSGIKPDLDSVSLAVKYLPEYRNSDQNRARRAERRAATAAKADQARAKREAKLRAKADALRAQAAEVEAMLAKANGEVPEDAQVIELRPATPTVEESPEPALPSETDEPGDETDADESVEEESPETITLESSDGFVVMPAEDEDDGFGDDGPDDNHEAPDAWDDDDF